MASGHAGAWLHQGMKVLAAACSAYEIERRPRGAAEARSHICFGPVSLCLYLVRLVGTTRFQRGRCRRSA
jgi:hypothetical protein